MKERVSEVLACLGGRHAQLGGTLLVLVAVLIVRLGMGFEFPVPWNDETAFISQAFEFSQGHGLYVYGLNTERVVMWMPPGYMLLLAGAYKLFGYSFEISRWVSSLLYLGAFGVALVMLRGLSLATWRSGIGLLLTVLAFLSPYSLVISNIARMEALYLLLFLCSLCAMLRGQPMLGLALVLASAVVHFNAVYMLLPYAIFIGWKILRRESLLIGPYELLALVLAAVVLASYGLFVSRNLDGFVQDMKFQFDYKLGQSVMGGVAGWLKVGAITVLALGQLVARRRFAEDVILSLYAAGFMALALNGHSMWYSFAFVFSIWLVLLGLLLDSEKWQEYSIVHSGVLVLGAVLLLPLAKYSLAKTPEMAPIWPRVELLRKSFLGWDEISKVRNFIEQLPPGKRVSFGYTGIEPFFLADLASVHALWSVPMHSVVQVFPARENDFRVFCDSSLYPKYVFIFDWEVKARAGKDSGCEIIPMSSGGEQHD